MESGKALKFARLEVDRAVDTFAWPRMRPDISTARPFPWMP